MTDIHKTAVVPYSADEMYALVVDIESYPDFLPWCAGAKLINRDEHHSFGTVVLKAGKIRYSFTTENIVQPGREIKMRHVKGPFKHLNGSWQFEPADNTSCAVTLDVSFEFKNKVIKLALGKILNRIMGTMIDSFTQRAIEIYGQR